MFDLNHLESPQRVRRHQAGSTRTTGRGFNSSTRAPQEPRLPSCGDFLPAARAENVFWSEVHQCREGSFDGKCPSNTFNHPSHASVPAKNARCVGMRMGLPVPAVIAGRGENCREIQGGGGSQWHSMR
jgi:hypothetical protein